MSLQLAILNMVLRVLYIGGAISDMVDGIIARKLAQNRIFGSKLDTIADSRQI
ncbi:MAG: CDP-alcohol phosphatidyltransferase family protein [Ruminiclostridium sp.]|nr:CDP-alcohol phosphatidyltransferase family protein [Ruminiclostridium sp.]